MLTFPTFISGHKAAIIALVNALVHSCIDYCNILLTGIPKCMLYKIQRVQNYAARLVANKNRLFPSLALLKELHWLPVFYRSRFKILLLVYKSLHNMAPLYLSNMFSFKKTKYELRSETTLNLVVPRYRSIFGERALAVQGPKLWNDLPPSVKTARSLEHFQSLLKTHLFSCAFNGI